MAGDTSRLVRFANFARMARPLRELRPNGSSASRTSPEWLVRCAHIARVGVASFLTPHFSQGTARRATTPDTPSFLIPHFSSWATTRVAPTPSLLTPHSSLLVRFAHFAGGCRYAVRSRGQPLWLPWRTVRCPSPASAAQPLPGTPRNRLCRAAGVAPWKGYRRHDSASGRGAHSVAVAHSEMPLSGKRSAAPTRDTAEPALPGRWCRPLEGVQTTRQCVWAGGTFGCRGAQ